jgi:hypothetical protein
VNGHVGRTLLSAAFDLVFAFDFVVDFVFALVSVFDLALDFALLLVPMDWCQERSTIKFNIRVKSGGQEY